jgi:hypothetical protein
MCLFCEKAKAEALGDFSASFQSSDTSTERLNAESCVSLRSRRTPVTIITGFLGYVTLCVQVAL